MPQLIPAAVAYISTNLTAAAVGQFILRTALSYALSALVNHVFAKPKGASNPLANRNTTVRQPTQPRRMIYGRCRVGGTMLFAHVVDDWLHLVVEWAGHECEEVEAIWLGDTAVTLDGSGYATDKYAGYFIAKHHLGATDQTADTALIAACPDKWTTAHRLRGRCYTYIAIKKSATLFPTGLPNLSAIVKGKKVYDPRTTSTAWSENSALCIADYLCDQSFGLRCEYAAEIDETALIAAANVCDESVTLAAGGSESRYTCNGVINLDTPHKQNLSDMISAIAGSLVWRHGQWVINAGAYDTPTITLTDSDLRGPLSVRTGTSRKDAANGIKGVYVTEDNLWQPSDYPAVSNSTYQSQDGEALWRDLDLPFTTSGATAQRIAKITLERLRQGIAVSAPCRLSALRAISGGTIMLTNDRLGWSAKPFEVERWMFAIYDDEDGNPVLGVDLELRETASGVFDWNSGYETTVDLAPNTSLPSPFSVGAPSNAAVASGSDYMVLMADGGILPRLHATWTAPSDWFTVDYEVQYRMSGAADWRAAGKSLGDTELTFGPVVEGETYQVRVRSISGIGSRSSWTQAPDHVAVGKSEAPSAPDSFSVERQPDGTRQFTWTHDSPPIDVTTGGGYRIRYYLGSTSDWDAMTNMHTGLLQASPWETNKLAAGTYTFAIKTKDSSGNWSELAVFVSATLGDPRLKNVLYAQYDHLDGWPGTKTDCYIQGANLIADSSSDIGDLPTTIAALASTIGSMVTSTSPIVYETEVIDLGSDVAFTPLVTAEQIAAGGGTFTIKMKTGTDADGDVNGSWVDLAFVPTGRYVQIQISLAATNPEITQLTVMIDSETYLEKFDDVNTSTESSTWFSKVATGHFKIGSKTGKLASISNAGITALIGTGAGWTWELISKTQTVNSQPAAEFKVYNSSGTLADATLDVYLQGPKNG